MMIDKSARNWNTLVSLLQFWTRTSGKHTTISGEAEQPHLYMYTGAVVLLRLLPKEASDAFQLELKQMRKG